jgi:tetratricopeptide (TPR) repeat protein
LVIEKEKILSIAQKYILRGQSKKAIKEYLKLIETSPKDKRLYLKLGDLYLKDGENEKAIDEYLKLADLYIEEDLNFRAISIYKKVLSIDPKHLEAFHNMAKLYLKEGLIGSARSCFQNILEIKPDDQEALKALAGIRGHEQPREISREAAPAETSTPKHPHPPSKKAMEEKPHLPPLPPPRDTPIPSNETQVASVDKDSEMHYHLGIAYKEMELFDYAISEFELASSNPSIRFDCYTMLGNCFMEKRDYDRSIEHYKTAAQVRGLPHSKLARLYFSLGLAYEAKGMLSEALDSFQLVLKLDHSIVETKDKIKELQQKINPNLV